MAKKIYSYNDNDSPPKIVILSGSGISVDSGMSLYRGDTGLWNNYNIKDVCHYEYWKVKGRDKTIYDDFYNSLRSKIEKGEPNHIHLKIAEWEKRYGANRVINMTQNIDNFLEKAGCTNVHHMHGEITKNRCLHCNNSWEIGYDIQDYTKFVCPKCGTKNKVKTDVLFFNEPFNLYYHNFKKAMNSLNSHDILLIIGTSNAVLRTSLMHYVDYNQGFKVLNNLEFSEHLPERSFDSIFYEPSKTAIDKIDETIVKVRMKD